MARKSIICGIMTWHYVTQVKPETLVSSFKLSSGQSSYPGFVPELAVLRLVGFHQMHCCTNRSDIVHHASRTRDHSFKF